MIRNISYLPFKHQNIGPETSVGVIGIGGLGHLAVSRHEIKLVSIECVKLMLHMH